MVPKKDNKQKLSKTVYAALSPEKRQAHNEKVETFVNKDCKSFFGFLI
jgi:hypothetical protein